MAISNFYPGTTKKFSVAITLNGGAPNITADTVTLTMKKNTSISDGEATLVKMGDVTTSGASGRVLFSLTPTETAMVPGGINYDIVWRRAGGEEYVLETGTVIVLERVSDE